MEKKTIGKFISVLRRAGGMTQKELGEKLFVSDKTVSRWERDECTPELSLIPAIAEIFGITTDELLRGERNAADMETTESQKRKSEKQFRTMLHNRMVKFRNLSMISTGIALAALILALAISASFSRGRLACGIGAVLFLLAAVCQMCFASTAMLQQDEDDETYGEKIARANSHVVNRTAAILILILVLFSSILPLGIWSQDGVWSLSLSGWLLRGAAFAGIALLVLYALYTLWIERLLIRRGLIWYDEKEEQRRGLKQILAVSGLILAVLSFGCFLHMLRGVKPFAETVEFGNYENFVNYMSEGTLRVWKESWSGYEDVIIPESGDFVIVDGKVIHYPYESFAQLTDTDGNVVCHYLDDGSFCVDVTLEIEELTGQPCITVYTRDAMIQADRIYQGIQKVLTGLMVLDILACVMICVMIVRKKR